MAIMANEVLAKLQINQQEMIDILMEKVKVLELEVEHLRDCLEDSVLVN